MKVTGTRVKPMFRGSLHDDEGGQLLLIAGVIMTLALLIMATISATTKNIIRQTDQNVSTRTLTDYLAMDDHLDASFSTLLNTMYSVQDPVNTLELVIEELELRWNKVGAMHGVDLSFTPLSGITLSRDTVTGVDGTEISKVAGIFGFDRSVPRNTMEIGDTRLNHIDARVIRGQFPERSLTTSSTVPAGTYSITVANYTYDDAITIDPTIPPSYPYHQVICTMVHASLRSMDTSLEEYRTFCGVLNEDATFNVSAQNIERLATITVYDIADVDGLETDEYVVIWDMGDGTRYVDEVLGWQPLSRKHLYDTEDTYIVSVTIIDAFEGVSSNSDILVIR